MSEPEIPDQTAPSEPGAAAPAPPTGPAAPGPLPADAGTGPQDAEGPGGSEGPGGTGTGSGDAKPAGGGDDATADTPGDATGHLTGEGDGDGGTSGMVEAAVRQSAGRCTLPFQAARADRSFATAFWYNDLVHGSAGQEVIRQYLMTAESRIRYEIGQFTLRDELADPEAPADELVMPSFSRKWTRLGDLGVAVMPTTDLHIHAERGKWRWTTDEVTAGLAAQPADIALIGTDPLPAYVLGHEVVQQPGVNYAERPQALLPGTVSRDGAGPVRWTGRLPQGFDGAPVFAALPMDDGRTKLVCLGLALTGDPVATVVTFDLLRPAVHAITPSLKRRWWQRR